MRDADRAQSAATGADDIAVPSAPVAAHYQTSGWGGVPGECGVECACGMTFDHFGTIAEAAALLDDHIAAANSPTSAPVAARPRYVLDAPAILELVERYGYACAAGLGDVVDNLLDAIRAALTPVPAAPPKRWRAGDPQPGRSVTAVRDGDGDLWDRMFGDVGERLDAWTAPDDPEITISWGELLSEFGPLTDATNETLADSRPRRAVVRPAAAGNGGADPGPMTPGTGSADPVHIRQIGSSRLNLCSVVGGKAQTPDRVTCLDCLSVLKAAES